jgi:DNA-binding MarR family transcriptional regulator
MNAKDDKIQEIENTMISMHQLAFRSHGSRHGFIPSSVMLLGKTIGDHYRQSDEPLSTTQLAEKMDISLSAVTQLLDVLEKKGFVTRRKSDQDRRITLVELTKKSQRHFKHFNRHRDQHSQILKELVDYLGPKDSDEMIRLMKRINDFVSERKSRCCGGRGDA